MKRVGILGGTFNPIHNGHLAIAEAAREQFLLEKVLFMPSGVPYMKDLRSVLPAAVRCEMTALAIKDVPYFELSDMEAVEEGENTYTYRTLLACRKRRPDEAYFFILGADSLYAIETWRHPALIFQNCTVLAAVREDTAAAQENGAFGNVSGRPLIEQIAYLREKYHASIEMLSFAGMDVSSTQIRARLQKGESIRGLTPEAVEAYIRQNHLYQNHKSQIYDIMNKETQN